MSASSVVSKAVARPPVTPPMDFMSRAGSLTASGLITPLKKPMASERPMTVPMNPRMGMAQMKTFTSV